MCYLRMTKMYTSGQTIFRFSMSIFTHINFSFNQVKSIAQLMNTRKGKVKVSLINNEVVCLAIFKI